MLGKSSEQRARRPNRRRLARGRARSWPRSRIDAVSGGSAFPLVILELHSEDSQQHQGQGFRLLADVARVPGHWRLADGGCSSRPAAKGGSL